MRTRGHGLAAPLRVSRLGLGVALALTGSTALLTPSPATAEEDPWSLEREAGDAQLVQQRLTKLRRNPFDARQWSALQRALGNDGLARRVQSLLERDPSDVALRILAARASLAQGEPAAAAEALASLEAQAGRWTSRVFALRIEALEAAGEFGEASRELEAAAERASRPDDRIGSLERALELAERASQPDDSLRLAQRLATLDPTAKNQLRLARAARAASDPELADRTYEQAIAASRGDAEALIAEWAQARLEADDPGGAADLLWSLLEAPRRGSRAERDTWWQRLGQAHVRERTSDALVARLAPWLEAHPGEAAAWAALATAQEASGIDPTAAWRRAVELAPRDAEAAIALVQALEATGRVEAAVAASDALLERHPDEVQTGLDLASRLIAGGSYEEGLALAADIERRVGTRPRGLMLLLDFYNLSDEPQRALIVAERLVEAHPRNAEARIALGEQLFQMGRIDHALREWGMLPKLIRPAHKGWARHAEILSEHGRTTDAVSSVKKALRMVPQSPTYLRLRAVLAEEQRRPTHALALWEQVRAQATGPDEALLREEARTRIVELLVGGSIPKRRARLEAAMEEARQQLDRGEPRAQSIEAGEFLAELHTRRENYAGAVQVQKVLLALDPENPNRLEQLASAQRRAGQVQSAIGTLKELLELEPSRSSDVLAEMSELAFEAGDDDRALDAATQAAEKDRHQVEALVRLGQLHERDGDVDGAARAYGRALETTPTDGRARLRLAELELTRGNDERSAELLRSVLESGGPPELLREAGSRALDLAEMTGSLDQLLGLAVRRTATHPEADEPREFLLETLDRLDPSAVQRWVAPQGAPAAARAARERDLRTPLLAALSRGSVKARLRAADHLGKLALPHTALPLVQMGQKAVAPRDATQTVRDAYDRARLTAIRAAGRLRDPASIPAFAEVLRDNGQDGSLRRAAAWALAWSGSAEAAAVLAGELGRTPDPQIAAMACLALAHRPAEELSPDAAAGLSRLAREADDPHLRHACAFAEAALTPDRSVARVRAQLEASDNVLAAIAAWRLGEIRDPDRQTLVALWQRFLGPHGLARDAAGASLARLLGPAEDAAGARPAPPQAEGVAWGTEVERWLRERVAPRYRPLDPSRLAPARDEANEAIDRLQRGTRAELASVRDVVRQCGDHSSASGCLQPLTEGRVEWLGAVARPSHE